MALAFDGLAPLHPLVSVRRGAALACRLPTCPRPFANLFWQPLQLKRPRSACSLRTAPADCSSMRRWQHPSCDAEEKAAAAPAWKWLRMLWPNEIQVLDWCRVFFVLIRLQASGHCGGAVVAEPIAPDRTHVRSPIFLRSKCAGRSACTAPLL